MFFHFSFKNTAIFSFLLWWLGGQLAVATVFERDVTNFEYCQINAFVIFDRPCLFASCFQCGLLMLPKLLMNILLVVRSRYYTVTGSASFEICHKCGT